MATSLQSARSAVNKTDVTPLCAILFENKLPFVSIYAPKQRDPLIGLILISFLHIRLISRMLVHHHHTHDGLHRIDGLLVIDSEGTDPDGAAVTRAYPGEVKMCKNGSSNKSSHLELECHKNYTVLLLAHILSSRVNSKRVNQRAPVAVNYSSHVCSRHEH